MSDYGDDDYSDYGDPWMYIEDEYMPADDLAEHAVYSPPPSAFREDEGEDSDPFEYFVDLEYASDGYDDATFYTHNPQAAESGKKRKRAVPNGPGKKKQKLEEELPVSPNHVPKALPPVVWRSQARRGTEPKLLEENTESYALLKDWRERLPDVPAWSTKASKSKAKELPAPLSPAPEPDEGDGDEGPAEIDSAALMAALQRNLAAAGGPLTGMDPEQLLQFAMRMMGDQSAGDEIAGELANDILGRGGGDDDDEEEEDGEAPAEILSWLSKHREPNNTQPGAPPRTRSGIPTRNPMSPEVRIPRRPLSPPLSEATKAGPKDANARNAGTDDNSLAVDSEAFNTRKRKSEDDIDVGNASAPKKRATTSQPKAVPSTRTTRSRAKRS